MQPIEPRTDTSILQELQEQILGELLTARRQFRESVLSGDTNRIIFTATRASAYSYFVIQILLARLKEA